MDEMETQEMPSPQDAPRVNEHDEVAVEYEKLVDLVLGARADAIQFYNHGNAEAGIRMRKTSVLVGKYAKHLRLDSLAIQKDEERPIFDWSDANE